MATSISAFDGVVDEREGGGGKRADKDRPRVARSSTTRPNG